MGKFEWHTQVKRCQLLRARKISDLISQCLASFRRKQKVLGLNPPVDKNFSL